MLSYLANIGVSSSVLKASHSSSVKPVINLFESKLGVLTIASTSPVLGFIATEKPLSFPYSSYIFCCNSTSIVVLMSSPSSISVSAIVSSTFSFSSTIYIPVPFFPFSLSSNANSKPFFPIMLLAVYPSPLCASNSSSLIPLTYPTRCAVISPYGYSLSPFSLFVASTFPFLSSISPLEPEFEYTLIL